MLYIPWLYSIFYTFLYKTKKLFPSYYINPIKIILKGNIDSYYDDDMKAIIDLRAYKRKNQL